MIQYLFLYFARFPKREGVKAMFTNGQSTLGDYQNLIDALDALPDNPLLPEIDNYVYGQDFDELKMRVERLFGSWLYADYGEFQFYETGRGSIGCRQQVAVTVAEKVTDRADMVERMIISDRMLHAINTLYAQLMADSDAGRTPWLDHKPVEEAQIVPFVAPELKSYGWTLLINAQATDSLGTNDLRRALRRQDNPIL